MDLLSVNNIAFEVLGYSVSWIELVGTILYFLGVVFIIWRNVLTWPVSIVATALYLLLFWQIHLYADTVEQIFYLAVSFYGWWAWTRKKTKRDLDDRVSVHYSTSSQLVGWLLVLLFLSIVSYAALTHAHEWNSTLFPAPAAFPLVDGATTVASFIAMWLMLQRRVESWLYYIIVDIIAVVFYAQQGVIFISAQYVLLIFLAYKGWWEWHNVRT